MTGEWAGVGNPTKPKQKPGLRRPCCDAASLARERCNPAAFAHFLTKNTCAPRSYL